MSTDVNKVVERVKKLLALAACGGATEGEAALAQERAQEMMADHNLTMASVEAAGGRDESGDAKREEAREAGRAMYGWQRRLMEALASVNFCWVEVVEETSGDGYYRRRSSRATGYRLIGRAANVASARVSFDYLIQTVNRLVLDDCGGDNRLRMSRSGHSFAEGCADRLCDRLKEQHDAIVEERSRAAREANATARHPSSAPGTALAIVMVDYAQRERDLNEDLRMGREPGTTEQRRREREERERAATEARARREADTRAALLAEGIEPDLAREMAWYMACGYSRERAEELTRPAKPETETQKRKREERDKRDEQRAWSRQNSQDRKKDWSAYSRGQGAAEDVGLEAQIEADRKRRLGHG